MRPLFLDPKIAAARLGMVICLVASVYVAAVCTMVAIGSVGWHLAKHRNRRGRLPVVDSRYMVR